jgi:hypothetical protein
MKNSRRIILVASITLLFAISGTFFYLGRESNISVEKDKIIINGVYGTNILFEDIQDIKLENAIPKVLKKTNGMNVGDNLKGEFEVENLGKVKLFLSSKKTCIYIYTEDIIILNLKDSQDTEQLYKLIKSRTTNNNNY